MQGQTHTLQQPGAAGTAGPQAVEGCYRHKRVKAAARFGSERMAIDAQTLIIWLIIGAVAGWLAGQIMTGGGFGLVGNIIVGIVGALVGGWLLPRLGIYIGGGVIAAIINAAIGAIIVLFVVGLIKRA